MVVAKKYRRKIIVPDKRYVWYNVFAVKSDNRNL